MNKKENLKKPIFVLYLELIIKNDWLIDSIKNVIKIILAFPFNFLWVAFFWIFEFFAKWKVLLHIPVSLFDRVTIRSINNTQTLSKNNQLSCCEQNGWLYNFFFSNFWHKMYENDIKKYFLSLIRILLKI